MNHLGEQVAAAVVTAALLGVLGFVVSRWRTRRAVAATRRDVGRTARRGPGEWFVWTVHGPVLGVRPSRLRVVSGSVTWWDARSPQPRWQAPAAEVRIEVRRPGGAEDAARFVLHGPDGRHRIRVTGTAARPLGALDRRAERQNVWDAEAFVDAAAVAGVVVEDPEPSPHP